jgi:hypothetical protein
VSDEQTPETPAQSELELLRAEVRAGFAEMRAGFQSVGTRLGGIDSRLAGHDTRFDAVDKRLDGHDTRFVSIETRITTEAEDTRRHFDIVAEGLRENFKNVIDKTVATGRKVDRLIASNAIEHAAFQEIVTDHEVRITRLEGAAGLDPKSPATNHRT